jgi:hypothetical protein
MKRNKKAAAKKQTIGSTLTAEQKKVVADEKKRLADQVRRLEVVLSLPAPAEGPAPWTPEWFEEATRWLASAVEKPLLYTGGENDDGFEDFLGEDITLEQFTERTLADMIRDGATYQGLSHDGLVRLSLLIALHVLRDRELFQQVGIHKQINRFVEMFFAKERLEEYLHAEHGLEPRATVRMPTPRDRGEAA